MTMKLLCLLASLMFVSQTAFAKHENLRRSKFEKQGLFHVPDGLRTQVDFWTKIYTEYTTGQAVLHDPNDLAKVYSVIDLPTCDEPPKKECLLERENAMKKAKEPILAKLDPDGSKNIRVRAQVGQRDKFIEALFLSEDIIGEIEKIFKEKGLPVELSRLPFVESMFNVSAHSHAGAAGIWQFMPSTARVCGLKVGKGVDERLDITKSTHAAARHLKRDYNHLGDWALAVNAYNAGPGRLANAIKVLGTKDISKIIRHYEHPAYGFASKNFYPCFLAALRAYENRDLYFADILGDGSEYVRDVLRSSAKEKMTKAKKANFKHISSPKKSKVKRSKK